MPPVEALFSLFSFVWGAVWGSFLNVAIHRIPRGESVLTPASHCPSCNNSIRWFHNVPILSYLMLGGKCAYCEQPISIRYPLVELTAAMTSLAVWHNVVYNPLIPSLAIAMSVFVFLFFFTMALIAITFIDLDHMEIPDVVTLPFILVGLVFNAVLGSFHSVSFGDALLGELIGTRFITLVILAYLLWRGKRGMGWGDMKLMGMIGAFLGWRCLLFVLLAGSLQGIVYALVGMAARGRKEQAGTALEADADSEPEQIELPRLSRLGLVQFVPEILFLPDRWLDVILGQSPGDEQVDDQEERADEEAGASERIPFGPFLSLAALEWLFFSHWIENLFRNFFHL